MDVHDGEETPDGPLSLTSRDMSVVEILWRLAVAAALVAAVFALSAYPFDDAYIHLRLARNLAFHGEPYFNLADRVMSGSSLLWMLWLAAAFRVTGRASVGTAVMTECLVIVALFLLSEGFLAAGRRRSGGTLAMASAVTAMALPAAGGLMETPLAVVLLFGGLWSFQCKRFRLAGVLLGLAGTVRVEMILPALGSLMLAPEWKARVRLLTGAAPVWLAQAIALEAFYGAVAPQTMAAKAIVYQMQRPDLLNMGPQEFGKQTGAILVSILCITTIGGLAHMLRHDTAVPDLSRRVRLLLGAFPLALVAIYVARVPLIFPWYWTLSLCPMGLFSGSRLLEERAMSSRKAIQPLTVVAVGATVILACTGLSSVGAVFVGRLERSPWVLENARTRTYLNIGTALARQCPASIVAAPEIGALGWTFDGRILDTEGLASPEVLRFHPLRVPGERTSGGQGLIPGRAVAALRPDIVISMEVFSTDFTSKLATVSGLADYKLWWKEPVFAADVPGRPTTVWDSQWTLVFTRHQTPRGVGCSA